MSELYGYERRESIRILDKLPVTLKLKDPKTGEEINKKVKGENISETGIALKTDSILPNLSFLNLKIQLPPPYSTIKTEAHIVWWNEDKLTYGLHFLKTKEDQLKTLSSYINRPSFTRKLKILHDRRKTKDDRRKSYQPVDKRSAPRFNAVFPVHLNMQDNMPTSLSTRSMQISQNGISVISEDPLHATSSISLQLELPAPYPTLNLKAKIMWTKPYSDDKFQSGIIFISLDDTSKNILAKLINDLSVSEIEISKQTEDFFGVRLPDHLKNKYNDKPIYKKLSQQQIMDIIDFMPPFLRIDKMIVFKSNEDSILQSKSLAMGKITLKDMSGHYNNSVFLAMCGLLMASSASIHIAVLYPETSPQVVEANGVKAEEKKVWKPADEGTYFWVETTIVKKKLNLIITKPRISFDKVPFGTVNELKIVLMQKDLIWQADQLPPAR